MILVDTSVWVDHLARGDDQLVALLERDMVAVHPWVIGELALGNMRNRQDVLRLLQGMPQAEVVAQAVVLEFVSEQRLHGLGIGWVDAQLLASAYRSRDISLLTRDRRLRAVAVRLETAFESA